MSTNLDNTMINLPKELSLITGFNDKKAKIYMALLDLGEATAAEVAKKAGLKRTTVYNILPELIQESLVSSTTHKDRKYFYIDSPKDLKMQTEYRLSQIESLIQKLIPLHSLSHDKPSLKIHEGIHGLEKTYQDVVDTLSPGEIHRAYLGSSEMYQDIHKDLIAKWAKVRVKKNCPTRMITSDNPAAREWIKTSKEDKREIKIVKDLTYLNGELKIYGNKVALTSYREDYLTIVIESKDVANVLRSMFDMLWQLI